MNNGQEIKDTSGYLNKIYAYVIGIVFCVLFIKLIIYYFAYIPEHLEYYKGLLNEEQLKILGNAMNKIIFDVGAIVLVLLIINIMLIKQLFKIKNKRRTD